MPDPRGSTQALAEYMIYTWRFLIRDYAPKGVVNSFDGLTKSACGTGPDVGAVPTNSTQEIS